MSQDEQGAVYFCDQDGEIIPETLTPQFPQADEQSIASSWTQVRTRKSPFAKLTDRAIVDLLAHRRRWLRGKDKREWDRLLVRFAEK